MQWKDDGTGYRLRPSWNEEWLIVELYVAHGESLAERYEARAQQRDHSYAKVGSECVTDLSWYRSEYSRFGNEGSFNGLPVRIVDDPLCVAPNLIVALAGLVGLVFFCMAGQGRAK